MLVYVVSYHDIGESVSVKVFSNYDAAAECYRSHVNRYDFVNIEDCLVKDAW